MTRTPAAVLEYLAERLERMESLCSGDCKNMQGEYWKVVFRQLARIARAGGKESGDV